jgi:hypothetical protein
MANPSKIMKVMAKASMAKMASKAGAEIIGENIEAIENNQPVIS